MSIRRRIFTSLASCALVALLFAFIPGAWGQSPAEPSLDEPSQERPAPLEVDDAAYFAIKWDGKLIGSTYYRVGRAAELEGKEFLFIDSFCRLKTGYGSVESLSYKAHTNLSRKDGAPLYFQCHRQSGDREYDMECLFTKDMAVRKTIVNKEEKVNFLSFEKQPYMFFGNLWYRLSAFPEHYLALIRGLGTARSGVLNLFDPMLLEIYPVKLELKGQEEAQLQGSPVKAARWRLSDVTGEPLLDIWMGAANEGILRMADPEGLLVFERTDSTVVHLMEQAPGIDLLEGKFSPSDIYFPNPASLTDLGIQAKLRVRCPSFLNHKVVGYDSVFEGRSVEGVIDGAFRVKTSQPMILRPTPLQAPPADETLKPFLDVERGLEVEDSALKNKATEITWKSPTALEAARRVNEWVYGKVKKGHGLPSARSTLETLEGDALGKSLLATALLRSIGIPARRVGGLHFDRGSFCPHEWVEVSMGKEGWIAMDPTTGEFGRLSALHVFLWERGELLENSVSVLDFAPMPAATVPHQRRELRWPVGELRTFAIRKEGALIGAEKALVKEITMFDGVEAYLILFESAFKMNEMNVAIKGTLYTTLEGLPLEYRLLQDMGGRVEKRTYVFRKGKILMTQESAGGELKKMIPYSTGTYLLDKNLFAQWALLLGQMPTPRAGAKASFTVFIPQEMTAREISAEVRGEETIKIGDSDFKANRGEVAAGPKFHITSSGDILRLNLPEGDVEIELVDRQLKKPNI